MRFEHVSYWNLLWKTSICLSHIQGTTVNIATANKIVITVHSGCLGS